MLNLHPGRYSRCYGSITNNARSRGNQRRRHRIQALRLRGRGEYRRRHRRSLAHGDPAGGGTSAGQGTDVDVEPLVGLEGAGVGLDGGELGDEFGNVGVESDDGTAAADAEDGLGFGAGLDADA